jgi:hypothetical protein
MQVNPDFVAFLETTALPRTDFGPVERFEFATQAAYLAAEMGRLGLGGCGSGSGLATTMERATSFLGIGTRGGAAAGPVRWAGGVGEENARPSIPLRWVPFGVFGMCRP